MRVNDERAKEIAENPLVKVRTTGEHPHLVRVRHDVLDLLSDREKYERLVKALDIFLERDSDASIINLRYERRALDEEE